MENKNAPLESAQVGKYEQAVDAEKTKITVAPKTDTKGEDPPTGQEKLGDSDTVLTGTFTNFSSTELYLDYNGYIVEEGFSGPGTWPGNTLQANSGQQTMSMTEELTWFAQGPVEIYCTWYDPSSGWRFGIKLYAKFQMFGIGPRPVWYVMSDQNNSGGDPNWVDSGSDIAQPYTWTNLPFAVTATPTSGHTSLSVQVQITSSS